MRLKWYSLRRLMQVVINKSHGDGRLCSQLFLCCQVWLRLE
ncbi:hypothetical protein D083_3602 [Dickeya solani RNS 08.23.3.1.A]|nr:hypothetical protein D083_3602 [Dickeya solani RNS 08.23.3.1.A]